MNIISSKAFEHHANFIKFNFPDIYEQLDELTSKIDSSKPSDKILGDWIISKVKAEKVKILIGISGYDNTVKQVIKLPMYTGKTNNMQTISSNNRKRFKVSDESLCGINNSDTKVLQNWTSRNPVLYPNYFEEFKEEIKNFIDVNIDKNTLDTNLLNDTQDIIVVKTFFL